MVRGGSETRAAESRWLLLIHQLPPKPDYLRVKVRRRLQRLGAVLLKNTVYVLPRTEACLEDFQWLANEIVADGGEATICSATLLSGVADADVEEVFRMERTAEYRALLDEASSLDRGSPDLPATVGKLRKRLESVRARDFFAAPMGRDAERALAALEQKPQRPPRQERSVTETQNLRGATWVTRRGVFIDRIASAWLIRRFIDPEATFKFVPAQGYQPRSGELRFDMYRGEFTHEGDACTFETLLARFQLTDAALRVIAEIVHDIDLKDDKFERPETPGVLAVMKGVVAELADDAQRIAHGAVVFDGLYSQMNRQ